MNECDEKGSLPMIPTTVSQPYSHRSQRTGDKDMKQERKTKTHDITHISQLESPSISPRAHHRQRQRQQSLSPTKRQAQSLKTTSMSPRMDNGDFTATNPSSFTPRSNSNAARSPRSKAHEMDYQRLDMRYNDNEFAFTAHLIMHHIEHHQQQKKTRKQLTDDDSETVGCIHWDDFDYLWNFMHQSVGSSTTSDPVSSMPTSKDKLHTELTEDLLLEFELALKHRLKFISLTLPSPSSPSLSNQHKQEDPMIQLTRQVAYVIAKFGLPKPTKHASKSLSNKLPRERTTAEGIGKNNKDHTQTVDGDSSRYNASPSRTMGSPSRSPESPLRQQRADPTNPWCTQQDSKRTPPTSHNSDVGTHPFRQPKQSHFEDSIRQGYPKQEHALPTVVPEPIYEFSQPFYHDTIVDAYAEEDEFIAEPILDSSFRMLDNQDNLLLDSNDIFVGVDRSYEEETVVMRQVAPRPPPCFPIVTADASFSREVLLSEGCDKVNNNLKTYSPIYNPPQQPPSDPSFSPRQKMMEEAKCVTHMLNRTFDPEVKALCRARLDELYRVMDQSWAEPVQDSPIDQVVNTGTTPMHPMSNPKMINSDFPTKKAPQQSQQQDDKYDLSSQEKKFFWNNNDGDKSISISEVDVHRSDLKRTPLTISSEIIKSGEPNRTMQHYPSISSIHSRDQRSEPLLPRHSTPSMIWRNEPQAMEEETIVCDTTKCTGRWKDRLQDCFRYGPCHTSVWTTVLLPLMALGQVMVRLESIHWIALPSVRPKDPFRIAIILTMFWITVNCLIYYLPVMAWTRLLLFLVINCFMYIYFIANVITTRGLAQRRYGIVPAHSRMNSSWRYDNVIVGVLVPHLCVMQLLRHTCTYEALAGHCFTASGISSRVVLWLPPEPSDLDPAGSVLDP